MAPDHTCVKQAARTAKSISRIARGLLLFLAVALAIPAYSAEAAESAPRAAAWLAYWDLESGMDDLRAMGGELSNVQIFAATFSADDKPVLHEDMRRHLEENADAFADNALYLTVVNDSEDKDGKVVLKDPELITRLLATSDSRERHRRDLLELVADDAYKGLDIDYEKVKAADWPAFLAFCADLSVEMNDRGKRLRVVLEPGQAYYRQPLPAGPEYVVMAYNLFGGHSGPGPKANPAFLARLSRQAKSTGQDIRLALSTGGFAWPSKGKAVSLTEVAAAALAVKHDAEVFRDADSRYLYFSYSEDDIDYTVWYADSLALRHLLETGRRMGFRAFDIWRLGGLSPETLEMFKRQSASDRSTAGRVLSVGPGCEYATIGSAVDAAKSGDRIEVLPGRYAESLKVNKPGLTISCREGEETVMAVHVVGSGDGDNNPVLSDAADTLWRGVSFFGQGDIAVALDGFTGRFEHCLFFSGSREKESAAVAVYEGNPSFQGCVFRGVAGTGVVMNSYPVDPGQPAALTDFTYCLFEGFAEGALLVADVASTRLANCVVARCGFVLSRATANSAGKVDIVNSILYNNVSGAAGNSVTHPVRFENCLFTPIFNRRFWINSAPLAEQSGVAAKNCRILSPRFVRSGRPILVNFGIDDTVNIGVFDEIAREAEQYGYSMTLAVNTGTVKDDDWTTLRELLKRGHEVGSHTVDHTAVEVGIPMAVGYAGSAGGKASLTVERGKRIVVRVDGKEVADISLREKNLSLAALNLRLREAGVVCRVSHMFANTPSALLDDMKDLDISFPKPVVPLYLSREAYLSRQIFDSHNALTANLGAREFPLINPFAVTSPLARRLIGQAGFTTARAVEYIALGENEAKLTPENEIAFNVFNIPCVSLGDRPATTEADRLVQSFLMMLDAAKEGFFGISFYAHTYAEASLDQWKQILKLTSLDPNVEIATLGEIGHAAKTLGTSPTRDGDYRVPLNPLREDYRLRSDSPAIGKGVPIGLSFDFAGNAVDPSSPPNIGLYQ